MENIILRINEDSGPEGDSDDGEDSRERDNKTTDDAYRMMMMTSTIKTSIIKEIVETRTTTVVKTL